MLQLGFLGGDDPGKGKKLSAPLTYEQINKWSDFAEKNPTTDLEGLFKKFQSANPNSGIDFNTLKSEIDKLKGNAIRLSTKTGSDLGEDIHTGYSFPKMIVGGKDLGRVNSDLQTQTEQAPPNNEDGFQKSIPESVQEIWFDPQQNVVKYIDPNSGDIMYASRSTLNNPSVRKKLQQVQQDVAARQNMGVAVSLGH